MKTRKISALIAAVMIALSAASCGSTDSGGPAADIPAKPGSAASDIVSETDPGTTPTPGQTLYPDVEPDTEPEPEPEKPYTEFPSVSDKFVTAANELSVNMMKLSPLDDLKEGRNALISAESIMLALGLTANGSAGETLAQFEKLLGGGTSLADLNKDFSALLETAKSARGIDFSIANSVWSNSDMIKMKQDFMDMSRSVFAAESFNAPFDSDTVSKVNDWVSENTHRMIPRIIDRLTPTDVAVLVNCIAFEADWAEQYEDIQVNENGIFTNSRGEEETVPMMSSSEDIYLSGEGAKGFIKRYKDNRFGFAAILPDEGVSAAEYIGTLTGEKLEAMLKGRSFDTVIVRMPEFKFDWGSSIASDLKKLGLTDAFGMSADFSKMAEHDLDGVMRIDDVIHKTHIENDRNGTKAAAATAVVMKCDGAIMEPEDVKEVFLDRPFVFAIVDMEHNIPVFLGAVNTVSEQ